LKAPKEVTQSRLIEELLSTRLRVPNLKHPQLLVT
jgi:hypothetical protein